MAGCALSAERGPCHEPDQANAGRKNVRFRFQDKNAGYRNLCRPYRAALQKCLPESGAEPRSDTPEHGAFSPSAQAYPRSEEHTSELQSLMRISYAVFCLKKKTHNYYIKHKHIHTHSLLNA